MFKTKRKRAVVLALIAFFCTAATTYVAVDWKRLGGGFLAYFKGKGSQTVASGGGSSSGTRVARLPTSTDSPQGSATLPRLAAVDMPRHGSTGGGSGGHKPDDDLFKYGDPAAGGIPAGSFVVAQNETPGGGNSGGTDAPPSIGAPAAPEIAGATSDGDTGGGGSVTSPAPAPAGTNGGSGDGGVVVKTPTPPPPPTSSTPTPPPPTQSGGTGAQNPSDGDPTGGGTTPVSPTPPVSAVPEASNAAMMGLGALFLAVAATRQRKNGQA